MQEKDILIIHPYDKTTQFLDSIKNHLNESFENNIQLFNIDTNDNSHKECLEVIKNHPENGLIIFLGHGSSNALHGSKGDDFSPNLSYEDFFTFPDLYYYKENFISTNNVAVFNSKKVFCLSCNSNDKIAEYAMKKGAKVFLGFGNIPSSNQEFLTSGVSKVSNELVSAMKNELNYIISRSIEYSITNFYNFDQLYNLINFITNQRITHYLISEKQFEERYILTDYLYRLKKEIIIYGDKKLRLIEYSH